MKNNPIIFIEIPYLCHVFLKSDACARALCTTWNLGIWLPSRSPLMITSRNVILGVYQIKLPPTIFGRGMLLGESGNSNAFGVIKERFISMLGIFDAKEPL
jgi:hypothetical protein